MFVTVFYTAFYIASAIRLPIATTIAASSTYLLRITLTWLVPQPMFIGSTQAPRLGHFIAPFHDPRRHARIAIANPGEEDRARIIDREREIVIEYIDAGLHEGAGDVAAHLDAQR